MAQQVGKRSGVDMKRVVNTSDYVRYIHETIFSRRDMFLKK